MKRFANPDRAVIEGIGPYFIVDELPMTWTDGEISKHIERVLDSIAPSLLWYCEDPTEEEELLKRLRGIEQSPMSWSDLVMRIGAIGNYDFRDTPDGLVAISRICGAIADRMQELRLKSDDTTD